MRVRMNQLGNVDLGNIDHEVDRLVNSFLKPAGSEGNFAPAVDIVETQDDIRVVVELPGVNKDSVTVEYHDNLLILKGEKKALVLADGENLRRSERRSGSFLRRFDVSTPVNSTEIKAKFKDGVLTVTLPKAEEAKPREISIEL